MRLADDLHILILFDRNGRECYRGPQTRDTTMPALGASYLIAPDTKLVFKPYRRDHFAIERRGYETAGVGRRASKSQILAAAKRFSADGEEANAQAMLALL